MKVLYRILIGVFLGVIVFAIAKIKVFKRVYHVIHIFDENVIVDNFQNMDEHFNVTRLEASNNPFQFPKSIKYELPANFSTDDSTVNLNAFFDHTNTEGLMILHKDTVVFEEYYNGLTPTTTHISWSMAKSVVATLLGIAYDDGLFELNEPVTKYLPQFIGTGYDSVEIEDILQMSSGVGFNEDYGDFKSDINRFGRAFAMGSSLESFAMSLKRERAPGTYNHYVSMDTQVLGILLMKLTGKTLTEYLKEKLWEPLGMQDQVEWITDNDGMELALGGLNMTLRDYAKIGQLYLHNGSFNGQQIVSSDWVNMAITPSETHLQSGDHGLSSNLYGYGFQWWIPEEQQGGDFFAAGIYNQYIYVNPEKELVIVKLTANHNFKGDNGASKKVHIDLFQEMATHF